MIHIHCKGCVSDPLLVERYLKDDLGVPQEQIQLLLGSEHASSEDPSFPSRVNITNTLLGLVGNPLILDGDNIIVYFAGHGSSYSPSDYSAETLIPIPMTRVFIQKMDPLRPSAPSTEILSMPVDYGSPTSAIERSMQSSSRSLVARVTELPSFSIAAILVAIRAISHRPAHIRFPPATARLSQTYAPHGR